MSVGNYAIEAKLPVSSILDFAGQARRMVPDWATYEKSNFLNNAEVELVTSYIKATTEQRKSFLDQHGVTFFTTLISFLNKVSKIETLQFALTMIDDIITEDPSRLDLFVQCSKESGTPSWTPFLHIVETKEELYVQHQANRILVSIITQKEQYLPAPAQQGYFAWLINAFTVREQDAATLALSSLHRLLRQTVYRRPFFDYPDSIGQLRAIMQLDPRDLVDPAPQSDYVQLQYMAVLCIWVMSFDSIVASQLDQGTSHIISDIAQLMGATRKEKVVRMCLATLANLLTVPDSLDARTKNAQVMISYKVLPFVEVRVADDNFEDEDVEADTKLVKEHLERVFDEMSSFDEYASEISSGLLEWSPVHRSPKFWRENASRLNEERHKLLKILIQLLETSTDAQVLAVAAHDCGEYVRHYPRGKSVIETLGGKKYIMRHMHNEDPQVRYEALIAVQKLMTQNWGKLGKDLKGKQV